VGKDAAAPASMNPNDSDPISGVSPPVDDTPPGGSAIARPLSSCDSIVDEAAAVEDGDTATTPTAPSQPAPANRTRAQIAKQAATPGALVGTRRPENAPATLSALDEPTTPNRAGNATIGRPLRLHRVPAEALQVSQPAPIHPRGFPPSTTIHRGNAPAQTTPAKARAAASSAPTAPTNGSSAGSSNKAAYRVQPQRQPTMSVRTRSGAKR
jgi:hypothetical protein